MSNKKELICINCPMGCYLNIKTSGNEVISVTGNICKRGEEFAKQEAIEPVRVLTSLMRIEGKEKPFSVKTSKPISKQYIFDCVNTIFSNPVKRSRLPIQIGDVIIANVNNTGVDIISTQEVNL